MKHIIAFAGSNSKESINKKLATYAAKRVEGANVEVLDLNDYNLPLYGIDLEGEIGIPEAAQVFFDKIKAADGIVLSMAEHNGAYAAVFKNLFDWMSRIDSKFWSNKPLLLMATSPGGRGGVSVLELAAKSFPHMGGIVAATFKLPSFGANFSQDGIKDADLNEQLEKAVAALKDAVFS